MICGKNLHFGCICCLAVDYVTTYCLLSPTSNFHFFFPLLVSDSLSQVIATPMMNLGALENA